VNDFKYTKRELVQYRIGRADGSLREAKLLATENHWNTTVNRLYYACFYAISALLAEHELNAKTHSGAKILFHKHFIKNGDIDKEQGTFFSKVFDKRQIGDYEDFQEISKKEVLPLIKDTEYFLAVIKKHLHY
jgi:uncharacterized protein (UPF0332 family)